MVKQRSTSLLLTPAWNGLKQQVLHLAQFGGSMQVVQGGYGAGKTTFCNFVAEEDFGSPLVTISVPIDSSSESFFFTLVEALGLVSNTSARFGELIALLRSYVQTLHNERSRVVIAVDDAHFLSEAALAALISVLQGNSDSGVGLHLIFFSEPGLVSKIDGLNLLDVSVHDAHLPSFSPSEIKSLIMQHFAAKSSDLLVSAEQVHAVWVDSKGLPGRAIERVAAILNSDSGAKPFFKLAGLPVAHVAALSLLLGVLFWAFVFKDVSDESTSRTVRPLVSAVALPKLNETDDADKTQSVMYQLGGSDLKADGMTADAIEQVYTESEIESIIESESADAEAVNSSKPLNENASTASSVAQVSADIDRDSVVSAIETTKIDLAKEKELFHQKPSPGKIEIKGDNSALKLAESNGSGLRSSLDTRRILALSGSGFTLQIMALADLDKLQEYLARQPNKNHLMVYEANRGGKAVYILLEGFYADKQAATMAIANLPKTQQKGGPWPKSLSQIHREIKGDQRN